METRPCLISVARLRLKAAASPSWVNPTGSQKPTGSCTPSSLSKARRGEPVYLAQSPQALPVRPSWKNMPMMAIIASLPLAISALSLRFLVSGSSDASRGGLHPMFPGSPVSPWPSPLPATSQYAQGEDLEPPKNRDLRDC